LTINKTDEYVIMRTILLNNQSSDYFFIYSETEMDKVLQHFLLVARLESVSEAAQMLGMSQPAVTSSIKKLEQSLGVTVFERKASGMKLTEFGEILFDDCSVMQQQYKHMLDRIEDKKQHKAGKLRIGTGDAWWTLFIKDLVHQYRQSCPSASIQVEFGNHLSLMDSLVKNELELFIGHEIVGLSSKFNVIFLPLFQTYDSFFVNDSHPLRDRLVTDAILEEYPSVAVTYDAEKYSHIIENPLPKRIERQKQKLDERTVFEMGSLLASIDIALETNAVMPYPSNMTSYFARFGLQPLTMEKQYFRGTVGIYASKEVYSEQEKVIEMIKDLARKEGISTPAS